MTSRDALRFKRTYHPIAKPPQESTTRVICLSLWNAERFLCHGLRGWKTCHYGKYFVLMLS